jgi:hypothetical protein
MGWIPATISILAALASAGFAYLARHYKDMACEAAEQARQIATNQAKDDL